MQERADGMNYAPKGRAAHVVGPGEFKFAAVGLDHGHIFGMCNGLVEAGAELAAVYDPDPDKTTAFKARYPQVAIAESLDAVLQDADIRLVASASVPADRCALGLAVMSAGKDFFADKPPLTTMEQLEAARRHVRETGRKFAVYFSERLHVEAAVYAGDLIEEGAIGKVVQVVNLAPHRAGLSTRPPWFFERERYGGILCDIGSHQIEQFLYYAGARDARVLHSKVGNYKHQEYPGFDDFGDATLVADNGATMYFRVDWLTPDALPVWGDGRTFILGTEGYIELRKYIDIGRDPTSDHLYLVNNREERHIHLHGQVGFPFFGGLILDCLNRTEVAQPQDHAFKAIELAIRAQGMAERVA